jgi:hypothetical protein
MTPEEISKMVEDEYRTETVDLVTLDMIGQPYESVLRVLNMTGKIKNPMSQVEARKILEGKGYFNLNDENDLSGEDDNYEG